MRTALDFVFAQFIYFPYYMEKCCSFLREWTVLIRVPSCLFVDNFFLSPFWSLGSLMVSFSLPPLCSLPSARPRP